MKKQIFIILAIIISMINISAISNNTSTDRSVYPTKVLEGNFKLNINAMGYIGYNPNGDGLSLNWPANSSTQYLATAAPWIGAKKLRRNENGELLFWLTDANDENDCVTEDDPLWNSTLQIVIDTLTTAGVDGDRAIFEMLPAYNPLEMSELGNQYMQYDHLDVPRKVIGQRANVDDDGDGEIDEDELGETFVFPDPADIYCFNRPLNDDQDLTSDEDGSLPGFQTVKSIQYDFSPFGTEGDRDFGFYSSSSTHIPLNLAIINEYYTWPIEEYANCIVQKITLYNTNLNDTLYDLCLGYFVDPDIGPAAWGESNAHDDVSSYITDNDLAFSFDNDGDYGLTPGKIGFKIVHDEGINSECWNWSIGDGPDDDYPLDLTPNGVTANEKYWLIANLGNPDESKFSSLKQNPDSQINPMDTRFLYSVYGDQQGYDNPTPQSINLAPGESRSFYSIISLGTTEEEISERCELMEEFIASDFDYSLISDLKSLPYLYPPQQVTNNSIEVNWACLTQPDEFQVCWKKSDAPASTWQTETLDSNIESYLITDLDENCEYTIKAISIWDGVFLESTYETIALGMLDGENPVVEIAGSYLTAYPNPFNPNTVISFHLDEQVTQESVDLDIFNIKGQKVKTYHIAASTLNFTNSVTWNGTDSNGNQVASGVYYSLLRQSGKSLAKTKLVLIK